MATVVKDFKIKSGLIVEGATAKVNNYDVLTKSTADQNYIVNLVGGSGESENVAGALVLRDENGDFAAGTITAENGFAGNLTGDVTGTVSSLSNHDTGDLTEGTNLYFTDARAQAALAGLYDPAGSASAAQTAAESYANTVAGTAETNAKAYTDTRETAITTAYQSYADTAEADAIATAAADATSKADAALAAAEDYADGLAVNYDPAGSADQAESDAKAYTDLLIGDATIDGTGGNTVSARIDAAVAALVDGAPALLDTLNELAAAIGDDENFASTIATDIGTKVSKSGDTMTGLLTLSGAPTLDLHAATKKYVDDQDAALSATLTAAYEAYVDSATTDAATVTYVDAQDAATLASANSYTDGEIDTLDAALKSYADTAEADAISSANSYTDTAISGVNNTINALDTDDVAEGTRLYFTDERAQDAVAAAIAAGSHSNITITYDDNAGTISFEAENGVADSTTDDLDEGTTNLYFTDQRAVDALEAVVPNFTEVDINSVATQVAATQTVETASQVVGYSFDSLTYRSAKFLVKVAYGTHTEVSEVLLTLDTSDNIAITEYAVVGTNGSLSTISAGTNSGAVELLVTTANNNSTVTVMGTLLV